MDDQVISIELVDLLSKVHHPDTREDAEKRILCLRDTHPQFPIYLINILEESNAPFPALFMASILIKNYVKDLWLEFVGDSLQLLIPQEIRDAVKARLVAMIGVLPENLNNQLYTALQKIAEYDYPEKWPQLLNEMISKLSLNNLKVSATALKVLHGVFEKYRYEHRTQDLFLEIRTVIDIFAPKYLDFFKVLDTKVDNTADKKELTESLECILMLIEIFLDLSSQDIPDFFQDNIQTFLGLLRKYLHYNNPILYEESENDTPSIVECIKARIFRTLDFYSRTYPEEIPDLFDFCSDVYNTLTTVNSAPKFDDLVISAIELLKSIIQIQKYVEEFRNVDVITRICESAVIKNIEMRQSDVELFEDEPIEYVRRVFQGTDAYTRRRAASDLVSAMLVNYADETTKILNTWIDLYLDEYAKNPLQNWKYKDNAIYLFTILSVKTKSTFTGAITINSAAPVIPILTAHVLPELTKSENYHPLIKVDSMMCIYMFISQFDRNQLREIMSLLVALVNSDDCVIYTSALVCMERILSTITPEQIALYQESSYNEHFKMVLDRCFQLLGTSHNPLKVAENEYIIMAVFKIVVFSKEISAAISSIVQNILKLLSVICANPSNPKFNHYLFETLGISLRSFASSNPAAVKDLEGLIFSSFDQVISTDANELVPYVIQIMALLLSLNPHHGVTDSYTGIIKSMVAPRLWSSKGNVPALTKLICEFLKKDPEYMVRGKYLQQVLGIFQKLVETKSLSYFAFEILESVFLNVEIDHLSEYIKPIFIVLLTRLMNNKTDSYQRSFSTFIYTLLLMDKKGLHVDDIIQIFIDVQNDQLFRDIIQKIIIPDTARAMTARVRRMCVLALVKLITESAKMRAEPFLLLWDGIIDAITKVCNSPAAETDDTAQEKSENLLKLGHESFPLEYEADFAPLKTAAMPKKVYGRPMKHSEIKLYAVSLLKDFDARSGSMVQNIAGQAFTGLLA